MIIETSNLTKKYSNKVTALNNVSLSIDTGIFGLLGRTKRLWKDYPYENINDTY